MVKHPASDITAAHRSTTRGLARLRRGAAGPSVPPQVRGAVSRALTLLGQIECPHGCPQGKCLSDDVDTVAAELRSLISA